MCGIIGIFSSDINDRSTLESMTAALGHRGPDARGIFLNPDQTIGLGHTRLSVIDLSAEANQPFHSSDGRFVITFNGEIYNFQKVRKALEAQSRMTFRTHSDTEVIVEAFAVWGYKMAEKLEGMFAIAIADLRNHSLHLFRDRLGKKPLYYFHAGGLFAFASEIKSLLRHPAIQSQKKIDKSAMSAFLHLGYIPAPDTIYSNIKKFPAGSAGQLSRNQEFKIFPYWHLGDYLDRPRVVKPAEAANQLSALLEASVNDRLISDVPIGAFLSGGTDSSLVCAIAARQVEKPLKTFSIGFKESRFDESVYARQVARHLKTDHTEYILSEHEAAGQVETYLRHFDEPFADTSAIPTMLVSRMARAEVKVVLTGDGGDELFHGYGAYTWASRLERLSWKAVRGPLAFALRSTGRSRWERVSRLLETPQSGGVRSHIFSQEQYYFTQNEIREQLLTKATDFRAFEYSEPVEASQSLTPAEQQALFDLRYYLPDDLLVKIDRASMFYALECRCPLLDHRVVEYALTLEESLKRREGKAKWILKELLRNYLPAKSVDRPKWGFSVPLAAWMKGDLRYLLEDFLSDQAIEEAGLCNKNFVNELKKQFLTGKEYLYHRLWALIVLHKWIKENP